MAASVSSEIAASLTLPEGGGEASKIPGWLVLTQLTGVRFPVSEKGLVAGLVAGVEA